MVNLLQNYKTLGVINRTPNSFSDHGLSLNPDFFKTQLQAFLANPSVIIDVGFESTAPMNKAISNDLELSRFEEFLELTKEFSFKERVISFDTYKVKNFLIMAQKFKVYHPDCHLIFNDVSGVLDAELSDALITFRGLNFYYIYTFSHIPERSKTLEHMSFTDKNADIIEQASSAFKNAYDWFNELGMREQLILDPGFGFSKTFEQNWRLIEEFELLSKTLIKADITNPILIGLSKKSFLRKKLEQMGVEVNERELELLHKSSLENIKSQSKHELLFRVHNPQIL